MGRAAAPVQAPWGRALVTRRAPGERVRGTAENVRLQKRETLVGTDDPWAVSSSAVALEDGLWNTAEDHPRLAAARSRSLGKMCP
jgi:hypothetical protein